MRNPSEPQKSECATVLVVEDDSDIREAMTTLLELEGYQVLTAGNGQEALEVLRGLTAPRIILLDLMMPVMSGWEVLEALHQDGRLARIPTVVVTAAGERAFGSARGATRLLRKPVDVETLLDVVKGYCANSDDLTPVPQG